MHLQLWLYLKHFLLIVLCGCLYFTVLLEKEAFCWTAKLFEGFQEEVPFKGQELWSLICILIQVFTKAHTAVVSSETLPGSPLQINKCGSSDARGQRDWVKGKPLPSSLCCPLPGSPTPLCLSRSAQVDRPALLAPSTRAPISGVPNNFIPFDFGALTTPLSWKYCGAYVCTITCHVCKWARLGHRAWFIHITMHILLLTVWSYLGLQVKFRRLLKVFFTVVKTRNIESTIRSILKIILFLSGYAVSVAMRAFFFSCGEQGLLRSCRVHASHSGDFSGGARSLGNKALVIAVPRL